MRETDSWPLCFTRRSLNIYFSTREKIFANLFLKLLLVVIQFALICSVALFFQLYFVIGIFAVFGVSVIIFNDTGLFDLAVVLIDVALLAMFWSVLSLLAIIDLLFFSPTFGNSGTRSSPSSWWQTA